MLILVLPDGPKPLLLHFGPLVAYVLAVAPPPEAAHRISGSAAHYKPVRRKLMRCDFPTSPGMRNWIAPAVIPARMYQIVR